MKNLSKTTLLRQLAVGLVFSLLAGMAPFPAFGAEVILNPGYISGTIQVTGQTINSSNIYASGASGSASTSTSSGSYTLTVNVPQGSSAAYTVSAQSYLNNYSTYFYFPSQNVSVNENATTPADFIVDPGYIEATINVTGGTLSSVGFYTYGTGGSTNNYGSSSPFTFPVGPASPVTIYGYAYFASGGYAFLDYQYPSVNAGDTIQLTWNVTAPPPPAKGTIAGNITFNGATVNQHYIYASGPSYNSTSLSSNGSYSLPNLNEGNYGVYAYSYFNNYTTYMYYPYASFNPSYSVAVTGGATTNVDISANAAFLNGTLKLTGTKSLSQANSASLNAYGASQTNSYGGSAGTSPNLQTGAYSLVVTEGGWSPYGFNFQFYDPSASSYLNEYLYFYDYQSYYNPVSLAAGETVTKNLTYGTGTVTVNYLVLGGGTFSYPYLSGSCYKYDQNNQAVWYYSFNSSGNQSNVTEGGVTFAGMEGSCTLTAYAQVGGSNTQFGQLTVDVVPGSTQVIDIGGPSLTVTFPPPDYITSNANITVTGTATDDVAVASVTVNGTAATLTPPAPAPSVSFEAIIGLNYGPNQVVTIATDTSDPGKSASDTRTVYRDEGPPTLNWTPADGSVTNNPNTVVSGTANDDAGIANISVNGLSVPFTLTGNGNEVSFSVPFPLVFGANFIEVVASDISTYNTAQTHMVTRQAGNQPPDAICKDVMVNTDPGTCSVAFASVDNGSYDPDGDNLSLTQDPSGPYGLGDTLVTLTATELPPAPGLSASCSATVTVVDNTPPTISCPAPIVAECTGSGAAPVTPGVATASDACGAVTVAGPSTGSYPLGTTTVNYTATDGVGLQSSCPATIQVVDTIKPTVSCVESYNPSTKNVPKASNTNQDGFYKVGAGDSCTPPAIKIGSFTLANGETIKITQTPGKSGVSFVNTMGQENIRHFQVGPGDAVITATDGSGNATSVTCLVPPPPK